MPSAVLRGRVFVLGLLALQPDTREALLASPAWCVLLALGYAWKGRKARR